MISNSFRFLGFSGMFDLSLPCLPATAAGGNWNNDPGEGEGVHSGPRPCLSCRLEMKRGLKVPDHGFLWPSKALQFISYTLLEIE